MTLHPDLATRQDRNLRRTYATLALYEDEEETGEEALGGANPDELTEPPTDKEEPLKKKSKKEPKPKARTEIMTARQAMVVDVDDNDSEEENRIVYYKGPKMSATSKSKLVLLILTPVTMLTLDETTLYYYSLCSAAAARDDNPTVIVQKWQTGVKPDYASSSKHSSHALSKPGSRANYPASSAAVPSLTAASTSRSSSRSVLTKNVLITQDREEPTEDQSNSQVGGLSDDDETNGDERLAAVTSLFKEKVRLSSSVSELSFRKFLVDLISASRISSKWKWLHNRRLRQSGRKGRSGLPTISLLAPRTTTVFETFSYPLG